MQRTVRSSIPAQDQEKDKNGKSYTEAYVFYPGATQNEDIPTVK
jgi:hypothetical protein